MAAKKNADLNLKSVKAILDAEEKVPLHLFKDSNNYNEDLTVGINGYFYKIQRGVDVMVPRSVYDVVMESMNQYEEAARNIEELSAKAKDQELL